jgi:hypothetical protein
MRNIHHQDWETVSLKPVIWAFEHWLKSVTLAAWEIEMGRITCHLRPAQGKMSMIF